MPAPSDASQIGLPFEPREPVFVFARHPRARRYVIRVTDRATVRVTIPRWGSKREAHAFAQRERAWIDKQLQKLEAARDARARAAAAHPPDLDCDRERHAGELRARAGRELPARLFEIAGRLGLHVRRVSVRNQKWRWGSCSPSGHICLNWRLVAVPDAVRDYVFVHELMHLKRMDHSPTFWKLVEDACPDYRTHRRYLRGHADALFSSLG